MQQTQKKPVADTASNAPKATRRQPPEMRHDGKLVFKLVAVSEPKLRNTTNPMYRECYDIAKCWAPDGSPYVGRKLTSSYYMVYGKSEKLPDRFLHFELFGDGPQGGALYMLPGDGVDPTTGLISNNSDIVTHGYFLRDDSMNQCVVPYFSGGHSSSPITIALTKSNYKHERTCQPPFNVDTKTIDKEFDKRWEEAHKSKTAIRYPDQPNVIYHLANDSWGTIDLRITVSYSRYLSLDKAVKRPTEPESKLRKHSVGVIFKPATVPLRQMVRTTISTNDGKKHTWWNDNWMPTSAMADSGPKLEDIESIEIATCPFKTYTFPTAILQPDPARFASAGYGGSKTRNRVGMTGVATVESLGVYTLTSYFDRATKHYTADGKPWPEYPGEDSFYNQHGKYPYTIYEVLLDIDGRFLAKGGGLHANMYSLPGANTPIGKSKPLDSMLTYPGFKGKMKLSGEPQKGDRYLRVNLEVANSKWKSLGRTSDYIEHENKLLEKNKEWVHKWMNLTPFSYWTNESGELMLSYTEPRKAPKTVPTGIKMPGKYHQVRLVLTSKSGDRIECTPCWPSRNETIYASFNLNEQRMAAYSANGAQLNLRDLESAELQSRQIVKPKPIIIKMPPPVERSKALILQIK